MGFSFDADKLIREVTKKAADHTYKVMEEAKREMGDDGRDITINKSYSARQSGDNVSLANASFPSEEIKERFMKIVQRKMR
jgi:hypothetical protein